MRLVLVTTEFNPVRGGIGRFLYELYRHLPRALIINDPELIKPHWLWSVIEIGWRARRARGAILHINHVLPLGTVALILKILTRREYIITLHGMDYFMASAQPRKRWLMNRILRAATLVTVNSKTFAETVEQEIGVKPLVLYPSLPNSSVKSLLPKSGRPLLLSISRLVERKGVDTLISAMPYLPDCDLIVAGDGPDRGRLESLARSLSLEDRVRFVCWVDDTKKAELFARAHVFVLPTRIQGPDREAFGIVYLEAQAHGVPVVAGEGIGVLEALHPDLRKYAMRHSPETLANSIRELLKKSPAPKQLQAYALQFDPSGAAERLIKALKHL